MQRYRITTPTPEWEGRVGTITFVKGAAEVEADADAAAMYYFWSQGYGIEALDGAPDYEYKHPHLTPEADRIAELEAEIARLRAGQPAAGPDDGEEIAGRDVDGDGVVDKLPRKNASEAAWRQFAVEHGMSEDEANSLGRDELVARYTQEG
jgi:hypothetical protein